MKQLWALTLAGAILGSTGAALAHRTFGKEASDFFWNVKSELFGGLFTLSGLLLSVKTYIVVKLEEGVYSDESYIEDYAVGLVRGSKQPKLHDPLRRLSSALTTAVAITAIAAICQLAAAGIGTLLGIMLGFGAALGALACLVFCWMRIRENLLIYFDLLEKRAEVRIEEAKARYKLEIQSVDFPHD